MPLGALSAVEERVSCAVQRWLESPDFPDRLLMWLCRLSRPLHGKEPRPIRAFCEFFVDIGADDLAVCSETVVRAS